MSILQRPFLLRTIDKLDTDGNDSYNLNHKVRHGKLSSVSYKRIHILLSGFTQRRHGRGNGIARLADKLRKSFNDTDTLIELVPWYQSGIAEYIADRSTEETQLQLVGYSYGGQTAANVAMQLPDLVNVKTLDMTLIDAVRRITRLPITFPLSLAPLKGLFEIKVPDHARIKSFVQNNDWDIQGHRLSDPDIEQEVIEGATHTQIDNAAVIHGQVLSVAAEMHS